MLPSGGGLISFSPLRPIPMGTWYPWVCSFSSLTLCPLWGFKMNLIPHWWLGEVSEWLGVFFMSLRIHRVSSKYLVKLTVSLVFFTWPLWHVVILTFLILLQASQPQTPNTQFFLPSDCGHLTTQSLALNFLFSTFSFSESLYPQLPSLDWWGSWEAGSPHLMCSFYVGVFLWAAFLPQ